MLIIICPVVEWKVKLIQNLGGVKKYKTVNCSFYHYFLFMLLKDMKYFILLYVNLESQVFLLYSIATVYLKWWIIIINYRSTLLHIVNFNDTCLREATIMWSQFSRLMSIFCWNGICSKSVKTFCHCNTHISVWWFNVWSIPFIENDNDSIYHLSKHWVWQEKKTGPPRYISGGSFSTQVKCIRWRYRCFLQKTVCMSSVCNLNPKCHTFSAGQSIFPLLFWTFFIFV